MDAEQQYRPESASVSTEIRPGRRTFKADYKRRIVSEAAKCKHGELGLLLRREGLYHSQLKGWRDDLESSSTASLTAKKPGRKPAPKEPLKPELERVRRENAKLLERLRRAELIIDCQKKLCSMLGLVPPIEDL